MLISKSFIILAHIFMHLIHLELISVNVWGKDLSSLFCMWLFSCPSTIWWQDYSFPTEWSWHPIKNSVDYRYNVLILVLSVLFHWFMSVLVPVSHCFDYCCFVVKFYSRKYQFFYVASLFQRIILIIFNIFQQYFSHFRVLLSKFCYFVSFQDFFTSSKLSNMLAFNYLLYSFVILFIFLMSAVMYLLSQLFSNLSIVFFFYVYIAKYFPTLLIFSKN